MNTEKQFWKSKKWWAAVVAAAVPVANRAFGLDMEVDELALVIGPLVSYVLGQGVADIGKTKTAA